MTDVFDNELNVGDIVAYIVPCNRALKVGTITKLTPCGATIDKKVNRQRYQIMKAGSGQ